MQPFRDHAVRLEALLDASQAFAEASLDDQALLAVIARKATELLGDTCVIRLLSDDQQRLDVVAAYDADRTALDSLVAMLSAAPAHVDEPHLTQRAFRSSQPILLPVITVDQLRTMIKPEHMPLIERFPVHSMLVAPIRNRSQPIGTLGIIRYSTSRTAFTEKDARLAGDLADRAGLAIMNAQLYSALERELAERRSAQAQLEFQAQLLAHMHDAAIASDQDRVITAWNRAAEETYGWSAAEAIGQPISTIVRSDIDPAARARLLEQLDATGHGRTEVQQYRKDGRPIEIESIAATLLGHDHQITGYISINRDVTERKRVEEQLRQLNLNLEQRVAERTAALTHANQALRAEIAANARLFAEVREARDQADQANQAKSEFLSRMSHELRTPLNAILGFAQLLGMDETDREKLEGISQIMHAGKHLLQLINEVLDITRIETGNLAISTEPLQISELVDEAIGLIKPQAAARGVEVEARIPPGVRALGDRQRLKQALLNLLANAVIYNRIGGSAVIDYQMIDETHLRIRVIDSGMGIRPDQIARLFTPFERLDAPHHGVEGTGLGLALSRRLVQAMGGALGVESTAGVGSTFWIELPIGQGHQ
jgi:PAS domain S-box-containing protein